MREESRIKPVRGLEDGSPRHPSPGQVTLGRTSSIPAECFPCGSNGRSGRTGSGRLGLYSCGPCPGRREAVTTSS